MPPTRNIKELLKVNDVRNKLHLLSGSWSVLPCALPQMAFVPHITSLKRLLYFIREDSTQVLCYDPLRYFPLRAKVLSGAVNELLLRWIMIMVTISMAAFSPSLVGNFVHELRTSVNIQKNPRIFYAYRKLNM